MRSKCHSFSTTLMWYLSSNSTIDFNGTMQQRVFRAFDNIIHWPNSFRDDETANQRPALQ